ncbi:MAG: hypothetical protein SGPRY_011096 [Prymnesium sp.]
MKGLTENHALFLSVFACVVGCAACAWGLFPELNSMIHLEAFPDDAFRFKVMGVPHDHHLNHRSCVLPPTLQNPTFMIQRSTTNATPLISFPAVAYSPWRATSFPFLALACTLRNALQATLDEAKVLTPADALPAVISLGKVVVGMFVISSGPIVWISAFLVYKMHKEAQAKQEREARERAGS